LIPRIQSISIRSKTLPAVVTAFCDLEITDFHKFFNSYHAIAPIIEIRMNTPAEKPIMLMNRSLRVRLVRNILSSTPDEKTLAMPKINSSRITE
jgi:hypothetical protein